jgi:hypothetical protein
MKKDVLDLILIKMTVFSLCLSTISGINSEPSLLPKFMTMPLMSINPTKIRTNRAAISSYKSKKREPTLFKSIKLPRDPFRISYKTTTTIPMLFCSLDLGKVVTCRNCKELNQDQGLHSRSIKCNLEPMLPRLL